MRKKITDKEQERFLTRWSEKKTQREKDVQLSDETQPADDDQQQNQPHKDQQLKPEQPVLTDEDMPDVDKLDENSDYSGFLSPGVSDELRRLALRKLFRSEIFNKRDGLDDYDDDFRSFTALGDMITSDMKHQMELAEEKKERERQALIDQEGIDNDQEASQEDELVAENSDSTQDELSEDQADGDLNNDGILEGQQPTDNDEDDVNT